MVSKNQIKHIASLHQKKYRKIHQQFIAEGKKVIQELIDAQFKCLQLLVTEKNLFVDLSPELVTDAELKKMSALTANNSCLAVFAIPNLVDNETDTGLIVALDGINDPGNLGTIIRLCDWFGVTKIVCTEDTVDVYNPKVVQATMGSLARVSVVYTDLEAYLAQANCAIFGTFMEGENIYKKALPENAILVMGNEANGITESIENKITEKISIPRFGALQKTESLNVASATAICLSEFRRR
jgi:RNA methyltransferase, TrmH family